MSERLFTVNITATVSSARIVRAQDHENAVTKARAEFFRALQANGVTPDNIRLTVGVMGGEDPNVE